MKKILITAALPYANGPVHFGHFAGAYLPADCFARFERLLKNDVLFICGSDEYGIAITLSAEIAKRTPKEHVDIFHEINKKLFDKMNFSFDNYSRTTWAGHKTTAQEFFNELYKNGYIEEKVENHLFSKADNKFLADRYVVGTCPKCNFENARGDECQKCGSSYEANDLINPRSKLTGAKLVLKPSKHWYMRFDKFKKKLNDWIKKKDLKENVLNFTKEYIDNLKPRGITRDSSWGVPVPLVEAKGKVLYVWFDAPIGYISATQEWAEKINKKDKWKDYWLDPKTKLVNFIGKDNIPFHAVFFPAMIMGQNKPYKLVDDIPANEFLMLEGKQFSKSEGWYIDLDEFFKKYTVDQIRYVLAANAPENHDSDFSWKDFQMRCNAELVGKLGNFIHRTLVFTKNNLDFHIPKISDLDKEDENFLNSIKKHISEIEKAYSNYKLRKATQLIMELATLGNTYFDHQKPWVLIKENKLDKLYNVIGLCIKCIKALALIANPIIPSSSQKIWELIGNTSSLCKEDWMEVKKLEVKGKINKPEVIFQKVEDEDIKEEIMNLENSKKRDETESDNKKSLKEQITYKDFDKLDMRVGQIVSSEKVQKSEKLLKIQVDLGFETRQIVSGIAKSINPNALIDKKVIVLVNLKPAKIMGIESQGMILAGGEKDDELEIPFIQELKPGSIVS